MALAGKSSASAGGLLPDFASAVPHHFTVQNDGPGGIPALLERRREHRRGTVSDPTREHPTTLITHRLPGGARRLRRDRVRPGRERVRLPPGTQPLAHHRVALYDVRTALDDGTGGSWGGIVGGQSLKTTFCSDRLDQARGQLEQQRAVVHGMQARPLARGSRSAGSTSTTTRLEGQEVKITGIAAGIYYLVTTANPDGNFLETTPSNNTAWTSFRLTRGSGNAKITEISHSPCTGGLCGEQSPNR